MRATPRYPDWPRLLGADLASLYLGISRSTFLREVGNRWPKPIRLGRRTVWDKIALDQATDELSGVIRDDPLMQALEK